MLSDTDNNVTMLTVRAQAEQVCFPLSVPVFET
jgi:hypothetical protein